MGNNFLTLKLIMSKSRLRKHYKQQKHIIPILVDGAKMPNSVDLPSSIQNLVFINGDENSRKPGFQKRYETLNCSFEETL